MINLMRWMKNKFGESDRNLFDEIDKKLIRWMKNYLDEMDEKLI